MKQPNFINQLKCFFRKASEDDRLNCSHVSMYVALFLFWNKNFWRNPISIARSEIMKLSKIGAKVTYHKCLRELDDYGYLRYFPSNDSLKGSTVHMIKFETTDKASHGQPNIKSETSAKHAVVPFKNDLNLLNIKNKEDDSLQFSNNEQENKFKINNEAADPKKIKGKRQRNELIKTPDIKEIKEFFLVNNQTEVDADKFFNYYESNGWKIGGKSPMKNWKAAARNWILRSAEFNISPGKKEQTLKPGDIKLNKNKRYDIKL